jgi:hypothetical protein
LFSCASRKPCRDCLDASRRYCSGGGRDRSISLVPPFCEDGLLYHVLN